MRCLILVGCCLATAASVAAQVVVSSDRPALILNDETPGAKSLTLEVEQNIADFRERAISGQKSGLWIDLGSVPDPTTYSPFRILTAQINVGNSPAGNNGSSRVEITSRHAGENLFRLSGKEGQSGPFMDGFRQNKAEAYFIINNGGTFMHDTSAQSEPPDNYAAVQLWIGGYGSLLGELTRMNTTLPYGLGGALMGIQGGSAIVSPIYMTHSYLGTAPVLVIQKRPGDAYQGNLLEIWDGSNPAQLLWSVDERGDLSRVRIPAQKGTTAPVIACFDETGRLVKGSVSTCTGF